VTFATPVVSQRRGRNVRRYALLRLKHVSNVDEGVGVVLKNYFGRGTMDGKWETGNEGKTEDTSRRCTRTPLDIVRVFSVCRALTLKWIARRNNE